MSKDLKEYRSYLVNAEQKSQEDYDKTVLSLSAGALGISFAFLKDMIGPGPILHKSYLFGAWMCWGISSSVVLFSFFASNLALRRAIKQVDEGTIYKQRPGGWFDTLTAILNALGGVLFLVGVVLIALFVLNNLEAINVQK